MRQPYLILPLIILLPLLPAYVLYRNLPSKAMVSGPLKGFSIKLSGAFAAYFALVLLVVSTHKLWNPQFEQWQVTGTVEYEGGNAKSLRNSTRILLIPPQISENPDGSFLVSFKLPQGLDKSNLPTLAFDVPGYQFKRVDLGREDDQSGAQDDRVVIDGRNIELKNPIKLIKEKPSQSEGKAYNANDAQSAQPAGGS